MTAVEGDPKDDRPLPTATGAEAPPADAPDATEAAAPEAHREPARELLRFLPDVARLLRDLALDPRVSLRAKLLAGATAVYLVSPIDVVPDFIPRAGQVDDLALALWAVRQLLRSAGYDVLQDLWRGSDDGFFLLLMVAGIER